MVGRDGFCSILRGLLGKAKLGVGSVGEGLFAVAVFEEEMDGAE
jgi:hypothetical protein